MSRERSKFCIYSCGYTRNSYSKISTKRACLRIGGMCGTRYNNISVASSVLLGYLDLLVDLAFLLKVTCSYIVLRVHGRHTRASRILANYSVDALIILRVQQAGYWLRFSAIARNMSLAFVLYSQL